jgi:hypothetical protein
VGTVSELELLLDEGRLEGAHAVERVVAPDRVAAIVDQSDLSDARAAIEELCLAWGGACGALLPADRGSPQLPPRWGRFLDGGVFDQLAHREIAESDAERREVFTTTDVRGEPLLSVLWGRRDPEKWPICDCSLPPPDDPWHVAYLACLGAWPVQPAPKHLTPAGLVEGFRFEQLVRVERDVVTDPGPIDLIARLRRQGYTWPAQLSVHGLALWRLPEASHTSDEPGLPHPGWDRSRYGANLVVVYEPGSVEDLALIWNLRAAHGLYPGVPVAVPATADVPKVLRAWSSVDSESWALRLFGLVMGRPWGLISTTVGRDRLARWAEQAHANWAAADVDVVLHPGQRPGRPSADVAVFRDGRARIPALTSEDREFLRNRPTQAHTPELRVRLNPAGRHLPPSRILARWLPTLWGYRGGGSEHEGGRLDAILDLDWPSGWRVLEALARDIGLKAAPSRPGRAATALLRRLGAFAELQPLLDPAILETLTSLGARSGRAWFEQQIRDLHAGLSLVGDHALERSRAIERQLAELALPPFDADRTEVTWDGLQQLLSSRAAHEWLGWAESRELLVRGAEVSCDGCRAREWRPAAELAAPVICRGCGRSIRRPFPADRLVFRYRASEMLRQTLQHNALPHLLAARWLATLLEPHGLYGLHPGVEFRDESGTAVAEIDVVLVFANGTLALGECKLTPRGLIQDDVDRLEALADAVGAGWTFYAVPAWLSDCGELWQQLPRGSPERPRFVLTNEQLLQPADEVVWAHGTDPLRPAAADDAQRTAWHEQFVARLAADRVDRTAPASGRHAARRGIVADGISRRHAALRPANLWHEGEASTSTPRPRRSDC